MTSYPYLIDLFKGILTRSKAMQGRFHISYRYGAQEINSDQLGELLKDFTDTKKYPMVLMVAPRSHLMPSVRAGEWELYRCILFFVKTMFYNEVGTSSMNSKTKTSLHTVPEDWHDMHRCAVNFVRQLDSVQRAQQRLFRLPKTTSLIMPISGVGTDRTVGVRLDFDIELYLGCELEDYDEYVIELDIISDSHPEHKL